MAEVIPLPSRTTRKLLAPPADGLTDLQARIRLDLATLDHPRERWREARRTSSGAPLMDVLVVGAGQGGLATAFGLARERVRNFLVIDRKREGDEPVHGILPSELPPSLPRDVVGPDLGIANLTFRAWYEAQHGRDAWEAIDAIPPRTWRRYLRWYRSVLKLPVHFETEAGAIRWNPEESCFEVPISAPAGECTVHARKVILATGVDGSGAWDVPDAIRGDIPRDRYAHVREPVNAKTVRGRRVGVLAGGEAAYDDAVALLEAGASEVRLFLPRRSATVPEGLDDACSVGFLKHHADLPDALKWRFALQARASADRPAPDARSKATSHAGFRLHPDAGVPHVEAHADGVHIVTSQGAWPVDFVVIATGLRTNLALRPEMAELHPHVALWEDRFTPPEDERHEDLLRHPYLGPSFELTEKNPGAAPWLSGVFNYSFGCTTSFGFGGACVPGMRHTLPRLLQGVTRQLYFEDATRPPVADDAEPA